MGVHPLEVPGKHEMCGTIDIVDIRDVIHYFHNFSRLRSIERV